MEYKDDPYEVLEETLLTTAIPTGKRCARCKKPIYGGDGYHPDGSNQHSGVPVHLICPESKDIVNADGAIAEVDSKYKAIISGHKRLVGDSGFTEVIEFLYGIAETIEASFVFELGFQGNHGYVEIAMRGTSWLLSGARFCEITGTEYSKFRDGKINEEDIRGIEIGITVGDSYGRNIVTGFYPVNELSTLPVID
jgi:hypothetical protein